MDYDNKVIRVATTTECFAFAELVIKEKPKRIIKFPDYRQRILVSIILVLLLMFIYSDIKLLSQAPLVNSLLILLWSAVMAGITYYLYRKEYSLTLNHKNDILVLKLSEQEKNEFFTKFSNI